MVSQTNIATGAATSFAFDPMNRLLGVVATNASGQITLSVAYSYDLQGDLLSRTAKYYNNGTLTNTNVSDFVFDPVSGNVVLAFNGSGALTDRYLYGPAVNELLADERVSSLSSAGTNLWTAIDNEGSVRNVWEDGVGLIDHIVYNSFGAITSQTNSYDAPLIGYTGSFTDPDTGLQWHNDPTGKQIGRWYDPKTQQWIGPDPDGLAPDSNPYRYVGNSPTNATDPSGLQAAEEDRDEEDVREEAWRRFEATWRYNRALGDGTDFNTAVSEAQAAGVDPEIISRAQDKAANRIAPAGTSDENDDDPAERTEEAILDLEVATGAARTGAASREPGLDARAGRRVQG